jgi:hypothetical protein
MSTFAQITERRLQRLGPGSRNFRFQTAYAVVRFEKHGQHGGGVSFKLNVRFVGHLTDHFVLPLTEGCSYVIQSSKPRYTIQSPEDEGVVNALNIHLRQ